MTIKLCREMNQVQQWWASALRWCTEWQSTNNGNHSAINELTNIFESRINGPGSVDVHLEHSDSPILQKLGWSPTGIDDFHYKVERVSTLSCIWGTNHNWKHLWKEYRWTSLPYADQHDIYSCCSLGHGATAVQNISTSLAPSISNPSNFSAHFCSCKFWRPDHQFASISQSDTTSGISSHKVLPRPGRWIWMKRLPGLERWKASKETDKNA